MKPRIAIPLPTSTDPEYNQRSWPQYAEAVTRAGGEPVSVPLDSSPAETATLIANCAGILLPGSGADVNPQKYGAALDPASAPADPARENVDELLLQDAHNMGKPILTICFGTQMLNVWRGGSLIQDLPKTPIAHPQKGVLDAHPIQVEADSLLSQSTESKGVISVNSSHHQAIATPGDGLRVSARSSEDGVIEAVEGGQSSAPDQFVVGVQWHPERTYDHSPASRNLFHRFISEAAAWSPKAPQTSQPLAK